MKKKSILALCCTYYQLIVLIQLKKTVFKNDDITLLLTNDSSNAENVSRRLKNTKVFKRVCFINKTQFTKDQYYYLHHAQHLIRCILGVKDFSFLNKYRYDLFLFFNDDMYTYWLYASLTKYNPEIKVAAFEEGLISYERAKDYKKKDDRFEYKIVRIFRTLFKKPNLLDNLKSFYCFYPELYNGDLEVIRIPVIDVNNNYYSHVLCEIFEIDPDLITYDEKYIYFASLLDTEGDGVKDGEINIAKKIANVVGYENLIVKAHPRDDVSRFKNAGLKIDNYSSVPFEICQLTKDFSNHVFITALSGAVLTINLIVEKPANVIFVSNLYEKRSKYITEWSAKYEKLLLTLKQKGLFTFCRVLNNENELVEIINNEEK